MKKIYFLFLLPILLCCHTQPNQTKPTHKTKGVLHTYYQKNLTNTDDIIYYYLLEFNNSYYYTSSRNIYNTATPVEWSKSNTKPDLKEYEELSQEEIDTDDSILNTIEVDNETNTNNNESETVDNTNSDPVDNTNSDPAGDVGDAGADGGGDGGGE